MFNAPEIDSILEMSKYELISATRQKEFNGILCSKFSTYDIVCKTIRKRDLEKKDYCIGGLYSAETDKIYMEFYLPRYDKIVDVTHDNWTCFKFLFSQTLQHELIHRYQYAVKDEDLDYEEWDHRGIDDLDPEEERDYLRDSDEIQAYSHDIALEILYYYQNRNPYDVLRKIDKTKKVWSYNYYKKLFKKKHPQEWELIRKKLLKKAYGWLPHSKVYF